MTKGARTFLSAPAFPLLTRHCCEAASFPSLAYSGFPSNVAAWSDPSIPPTLITTMSSCWAARSREARLVCFSNVSAPICAS